MESSNICPCNNCICVAICRYKYYVDTFHECSLLYNYEPYFDAWWGRDPDKIVNIFEILNPEKWFLEILTGKQIKNQNGDIIDRKKISEHKTYCWIKMREKYFLT